MKLWNATTFLVSRATDLMGFGGHQTLRQDFIALSFCLHWNPIAYLNMSNAIRNRSRIIRNGNKCFFQTSDQKFSLLVRLPTQNMHYSLTNIVISLLTTSFMRCL